MGHGTGSTNQLYDADATGKEGAWSHKVGNPHNQTLYVAIEWGLTGCLLLFAMWFCHFRLFTGRAGLTAWIGTVIVTQNAMSSLFNSHLFDFAEGWLYVVGVGVTGAAMLQPPAPVSPDAAGRRSDAHA